MPGPDRPGGHRPKDDPEDPPTFMDEHGEATGEPGFYGKLAHRKPLNAKITALIQNRPPIKKAR